MAPELTLLLLSAGSFTLMVALPRLARRTAVYMIHDVRESVYAFGDRVPGAKESRLFQDLLFLCATALRTVREGRIREILGLALTVVNAELSASHGEADLEPCFQNDIAKVEIVRLGRRIRRIGSAAWWATLWSSPFAILIISPVRIFAWLAVTARRWSRHSQDRQEKK